MADKYFSVLLSNTLLDAFLGETGITPPPSVFIGLSRAFPGEDGSGIDEPDGGTGYTRIEVENTDLNWPAASAKTKANGITISFPVPTASWGTITHWFMMDSAVGGIFICSGRVDPAKTIDDGDQCSFGVGDLTITLG